MAGILAICGPFFIKLSAQIWFDHTHRFSDGRGCQRFVTAALIVQAGEQQCHDGNNNQGGDAGCRQMPVQM